MLKCNARSCVTSECGNGSLEGSGTPIAHTKYRDGAYLNLFGGRGRETPIFSLRCVMSYGVVAGDYHQFNSSIIQIEPYTVNDNIMKKG